MKQFILDYILPYLYIHMGFGSMGLIIELLNNRILRVRHFIFAILFGPLFMIAMVEDLNTIVIRLPEKKIK